MPPDGAIPIELEMTQPIRGFDYWWAVPRERVSDACTVRCVAETNELRRARVYHTVTGTVAHDRLELFHQLERAVGTMLRLFRQQTHDRALEGGRNSRTTRRKRIRLIIGDSQKQQRVGARAERKLSGEQFVQYHAQRPQIG